MVESFSVVVESRRLQSVAIENAPDVAAMRELPRYSTAPGVEEERSSERRSIRR